MAPWPHAFQRRQSRQTRGHNVQGQGKLCERQHGTACLTVLEIFHLEAVRSLRREGLGVCDWVEGVFRVWRGPANEGCGEGLWVMMMVMGGLGLGSRRIFAEGMCG